MHETTTHYNKRCVAAERPSSVTKLSTELVGICKQQQAHTLHTTTLRLKKNMADLYTYTRETIDSFLEYLTETLLRRASNHILLHFPTSTNKCLHTNL